MTDATDKDIMEAIKLAEWLEQHGRENKMLYFKPIGAQRRFLNAGATYRERIFIAGNRVGKSETGAFEAACHATGDYPDDWQGHRFNHPTVGWVAGTTSLDVRNVAQSKLCGRYGVVRLFGTGFIPKDRFSDKPSLARGVTDAYDTIWVTHRTGGVEDGVSAISFKSYEQGRQKFQGDELDWGWCDEEPPMKDDNDVYSEFLTRLKGDGIMFITFTPMEGETQLTDRFLREKSDDRYMVSLDLRDPEVTWFTDEEKAKRIAAYPAWQRRARVEGIPLLGSGAVFPIDFETITEDPIDFTQLYDQHTQSLAPNWRALWGIDFGIGHPFAAVLLLHDLDLDVIHVHKCIRMKGDGATVTPLNHCFAMKQYGASVPVAWPHDGTARESNGEQLKENYVRAGALMLPNHATFESGGYSTEAGISEMLVRMQTGRLKVGRDCVEWFEEARSYHRKNGVIEKVRDDIMSATRIGIMMIRFAKNVRLGNWVRSRGRNLQRNYADDGFDYFQT